MAKKKKKKVKMAVARRAPQSLLCAFAGPWYKKPTRCPTSSTSTMAFRPKDMANEKGQIEEINMVKVEPVVWRALRSLGFDLIPVRIGRYVPAWWVCNLSKYTVPDSDLQVRELFWGKADFAYYYTSSTLSLLYRLQRYIRRRDDDRASNAKRL